MRFMMIVKANQDSEAGVMPGAELMMAMGKFNEEMARAGILLDGAGLQPSSKGARIHFAPGGKISVVDGPFAETKELIAGYWIIQVKSREEAIEWARRCPHPHGDDSDAIVELRPFFEMGDFPAESATPEVVAQHDKVAQHLQAKT